MQSPPVGNRSNENHDAKKLVKQLEKVVEQNREAYQRALTEFRSNQAAFLEQNRSRDK